MVSLFVGQRVRIVGHQWFGDTEHPGGLEGVLYKPDCVGAYTGKVYTWGVATKCGRKVLCDAHEIEPILPEGAQPSEFSFTELMDNLGVELV